MDLTDMFSDVTSDKRVLFLGGEISWVPPGLLSLEKFTTELLSSSGKQRLTASSSSTFLLVVAVMSTGLTMPSALACLCPRGLKGVMAALTFMWRGVASIASI